MSSSPSATTPPNKDDVISSNSNGASSTIVDPKHVEKLLVDELNALSFEERRRIAEEIHGVSSLAQTETVKFLQESLIKFEIELQTLLSACPAGVSAASATASASASVAAFRPAQHQQPTSVSFGDGCRMAFQLYATQQQQQQRQNEQPNRRLYCNRTLGYIEQPSFRLKFLRAELFNIQEAVRRYIRNVDLLYKRFGLEALWRRLTNNDLTKRERGFLHSGVAQLLPSRERGRGRRILVILPGFANESQTERVRILLYILQSMSDDLNTQRYGAVMILWPYRKMGDELSDPDKKTVAIETVAALPVRFSAVHMCLAKTAVNEVARYVLLFVLGSKLRRMVRAHVGTQTENFYALLQFGIPVTEIPLTSSGSMKNGNQIDWIRTQKQIDHIQSRKIVELNAIQNSYDTAAFASTTGPISPGLLSAIHDVSVITESTERETGVIECPNLFDVIFQQGGKAWNHIGNINFQSLVEESYPAFQATTKHKEKKAIIRRIIDTVKNTTPTFDLALPESLRAKPRFLAWGSNDSWVDISNTPDVLEEKVRIAFRDHGKRRRSKAAMSQPNTTVASTSSSSGGGTSGPTAVYSSGVGEGTVPKRQKIGNDGVWDARGDSGQSFFGCFNDNPF